MSKYSWSSKIKGIYKHCISTTWFNLRLSRSIIFIYIYIFFYFVSKAGVYSTTSTTENPYENKTVCYKYVGCFNNLPPFDNAAYDLPRSPEEIGTEFLLFTQRNPSNPDRLDYVSQSSVVSSHFQSSIQTKIIIHGFANTVKTTWLYNMKDAFLTKVKKKKCVRYQCHLS